MANRVNVRVCHDPGGINQLRDEGDTESLWASALVCRRIGGLAIQQLAGMLGRSEHEIAMEYLNTAMKELAGCLQEQDGCMVVLDFTNKE